MDLATIIGIISAFGLMIISMMLGSGVGAFLDMPSVLIVVGGSLGALLINYPLKDVLSVVGIVRNVFFHKTESPVDQIGTLVQFSTQARKEGVLALENSIKNISDEFLIKGTQMVVDGITLEVIRDVLDKEIEYIEERHKLGAEILATWGAFAPAFGMIGTLIGLVQMLGNLSDPSTIGPSMAIALITTFYGAVLANVFFLPMSGKLKKRSKDEILLKELTLEGIISIASGLNPRVIEQKLHAFLAPKLRVASK